MPLVFVHGVANRIDGAYVEETAAREALFTQFVTKGWSRTDGGPARIIQPFWGNDGASLAWGGASVPNGARVAERFGPGRAEGLLPEVVSQIVPEGTHPRGRIVATARKSLGDALDLLWTAAFLASPESARELAEAYAVMLPSSAEDAEPAWMESVTDDEAFAVRLCRVLEDVYERTTASDRESFGRSGIRAALMSGVERVRDIVLDGVTMPVADVLRAELTPRITDFLGDVLTYYRQRTAEDGTGPGIDGKIAEVLREANAERGPRDPFVVVAHSMGGNIAYDLLSGRLADEGLTVDVLVTVGSQVAFFEELSLFAPHPPDVPGVAGLRLPMPRAVRRWLNVYDMNDLLSFRAEPVFDGVEDYSFRSGRLRAHSAYFLMPGFYARLAERLRPLLSGPEATVGEDAQ
jgi:hypothetical protein